MQYVLGVGFIAEKYRKNPKVRIFLDDLLVDEYEVENHLYMFPTKKTTLR